MRSWSPLDPTLMGTLARGGGGAHMATVSSKCWKPAFPGGSLAQGQNHRPFFLWMLGQQQRGDPSLGVFPGESPRNSADFRALPTHTCWAWGESSLGRRTGKTRKRLNQGTEPGGGGTFSRGGPRVQGPNPGIWRLTTLDRSPSANLAHSM